MSVPNETGVFTPEPSSAVCWVRAVAEASPVPGAIVKPIDHTRLLRSAKKYRPKNDEPSAAPRYT